MWRGDAEKWCVSWCSKTWFLKMLMYLNFSLKSERYQHFNEKLILGVWIYIIYSLKCMYYIDYAL